MSNIPNIEDPPPPYLTTTHAEIIIKDLVNRAKVNEINDSLITRERWKTASYVFEVLGKVFTCIGLLATGGYTLYQDVYVSYSAFCAQTLSVTFFGFNSWAAKRYSEQATITNATIDSLKTNHMPSDVNLSSEKSQPAQSQPQQMQTVTSNRRMSYIGSRDNRVSPMSDNLRIDEDDTEKKSVSSEKNMLEDVASHLTNRVKEKVEDIEMKVLNKL
jgi:hypothetical protein